MAKRKRTVAYLGPAGSFTHEAAVERFSKSRYDLIEKPTLEDVFDSVYVEEADYCLLPVENSTEGIIALTYHKIVEQGLYPKVSIQGEIYHRISHHLASLDGAGLDGVRFVHSKDQAWGQCRKWIRNNLLHSIEFVEEPSTSKAAQQVLAHADPKRAAICSRLAVELYKLKSIVKNIEDSRSNMTRFFIIGGKPLDRGQNNRPYKVTLAMALLDRVGAIADSFAVFARAKINVRTVKVSPVRAPELWNWKDWFFVDMLAYREDLSRVTQAIEDMRTKEGLVLTIRVLGTYPCAEPDASIGEQARLPLVPKDIRPEDVIAACEGSSTEFKSTLRWNRKEQKKDSELEFAVIKTIAGFMNGKGGILLIGVDDEGTVLGLDEDYKTLKKQSRDGFELHLSNLVHNDIGGALAHLVYIRFNSISDKEVCMIVVQPSPTPVWLNRGGKNEFYVRTGNQTKPFDNKETAEYVKLRWG